MAAPLKEISSFKVATAWGWAVGAFSSHGLLALVLPLPSLKEATSCLEEKLRACLGEVPPCKFTRYPKLASALKRYFEGEKVSFREYPLDDTYLSPFQKAVFEKLREIPYGEVRSYQWVAAKLGNPQAARAIGQACKRNPFPLLVPCHRVIRKDKTPGGFSYGKEYKIKLLALEKLKIGPPLW